MFSSSHLYNWNDYASWGYKGLWMAFKWTSTPRRSSWLPNTPASSSSHCWDVHRRQGWAHNQLSWWFSESTKRVWDHQLSGHVFIQAPGSPTKSGLYNLRPAICSSYHFLSLPPLGIILVQVIHVSKQPPVREYIAGDFAWNIMAI